MSEASAIRLSPSQGDARARAPSPWQAEDVWAIWLGLGVVIAAAIAFGAGGSIKWIAVTPARWTDFGQLGKHFADAWPRYIVQFLAWAALFGVALRAIGYRLREFLPAFALIYAVSLIVMVIGQWDQANRYNLEPPLVALVIGLLASNLLRLPRALEAGFRVEFYIKTGIVLLGATLPFTLLVWSGPVAIVQAGLVSIVTFLVIFRAARWFGLDPRLAATLGAGGSVCGVSAAIAVSAAVGAKKEHAPIAIATVILWAIVMIFVLPLVSRALALPTGVAGAWIGTSEFADAAGLAAAQAYAGLAGHVDGITGTADQSLFAFTLMKVVGRDVWIGIWAFVLAVLATTRWETREPGRKAEPIEIWRRFPKFVIGFLLASALITVIGAGYDLASYNKQVVPALVAPVKDLRSWAFTFCFLSIGLSTRIPSLAAAGRKPFLAFTAGVAVNVVLGFVLSVYVFGDHWANLGH